MFPVRVPCTKKYKLFRSSSCPLILECPPAEFKAHVVAEQKSSRSVKELLVGLLTYLQAIIEFLDLQLKHSVFSKAEK